MNDRRTFTLSAQQHQVSDLTGTITLTLSGRNSAHVSAVFRMIVNVFEPSAVLNAVKCCCVRAHWVSSSTGFLVS